MVQPVVNKLVVDKPAGFLFGRHGLDRVRFVFVTMPRQAIKFTSNG